MTDFKPTHLDRKWQEQWTTTGAFEVTADPARPKF
jgi:leucyl-tRNA synthetase